MVFAKLLLYALIIPAILTADNENIIRLGDFSNCIKSGIPCGWEKFKEIKGVSLQHDSVYYFVTIKSANDVEGIDKRMRFNVNEYSLLKWHWRVHALPVGAREDVKKKNDSAAGIYIAFKGIYPFNHVIKYVWSAQMPVGMIFPSPNHGKTMIFIIRSGSAGLNEWVSEKRDIRNDYITAFGSSPPLAEAIAIQTDSDNTQSTANADYADICASKN
jgi:hypothetical protein